MTKTQSFYCKYVPALRLASTLIAIYISGMTIAEQTYQSQSLIQVITIILMILVFLYFAVIKKNKKEKLLLCENKIQELTLLKEKGTITEEEFSALKIKVISDYAIK